MGPFLICNQLDAILLMSCSASNTWATSTVLGAPDTPDGAQGFFGFHPTLLGGMHARDWSQIKHILIISLTTVLNLRPSSVWLLHFSTPASIQCIPHTHTSLSGCWMEPLLPGFPCEEGTKQKMETSRQRKVANPKTPYQGSVFPSEQTRIWGNWETGHFLTCLLQNQLAC